MAVASPFADMASDMVAAFMGRPPARTLTRVMGEAVWCCNVGAADRAEALCHEALRMSPGHVWPLAVLGSLLIRRGQARAAVPLLADVCRQLPDDVRMHLLLAEANWWFNVDAAERAARDALALAPDSAFAHYILGGCARWHDDIEAVLASFRRALAIDPGHTWARIGDATNLMFIDPAAGFAELARVMRPDGPIRWSPGDPLAGRRVLIADGHGVGDSTLFCRYTPVLAARGARVTIATTWEPQVRLLGQLPGVERVVVVPTDRMAALVSDPEWGDAAIADFWALPWLLGVTSPEDERRLVTHPYVAPDRADVETWRAQLPDDGCLRVGIAWGSSEPWPAQPVSRSLPIEALAPLGLVPGCHFYSFQFGRPADALADAPFPITDLAPSIADTAETLAALSLMDAVVAADCGVANLAAAAAMPTWVLSRRGLLADWRWGVPTSDRSDWYPSARIFRQQRRCSWVEPVAEVAAALEQLATSRRAA